MERVLTERIKDIVLDKIFQFEQLVAEFESGHATSRSCIASIDGQNSPEGSENVLRKKVKGFGGNQRRQ